MIVAMLTTFDNPHDPFTEFKAWHSFDVAHGYHTTELFARLDFNSEELSDADRNKANTALVDEMVRENVTGMFRKVTKEVPDP